MRRLLVVAFLTAAVAGATTAIAWSSPAATSTRVAAGCENPYPDRPVTVQPSCAFHQSTEHHPSLATALASARLSTAKYATDLDRAKADGYQILTRLIPSMGYHYLNPTVKGFDIRKPPILVYVHHGSRWQLGALEWVFSKRPATPPIEGAKYGSFGAACHYVDGTFVTAESQDKCAPTSPTTGAKLNFWHGPLVTLHVWLWYPNPDGLYAGMNPLLTPFSQA